MNRTSTAVPTWQCDCESFAKGVELFELLNVKTTDQFLWVIEFCKKHELDFSFAEGSVLFTPKHRSFAAGGICLNGQLMLSPLRGQT